MVIDCCLLHTFTINQITEPLDAVAAFASVEEYNVAIIYQTFVNGLEETGIAHHRCRTHQGTARLLHLLAILRQLGLFHTQECTARTVCQRSHLGVVARVGGGEDAYASLDILLGLVVFLPTFRKAVGGGLLPRCDHRVALVLLNK